MSTSDISVKNINSEKLYEALVDLAWEFDLITTDKEWSRLLELSKSNQAGVLVELLVLIKNKGGIDDWMHSEFRYAFEYLIEKSLIDPIFIPNDQIKMTVKHLGSEV